MEIQIKEQGKLRHKFVFSGKIKGRHPHAYAKALRRLWQVLFLLMYS
jgi:hypothetical protein